MIRSDFYSISNQMNFYNGSFYPCLKKDNRLTFQEKVILMKYPEWRVKKAIEYSLVQSSRTNLMEQLTWHCSQPIPPVYKSFWEENRIEIIATIALSIVAIAFPIFFLRHLESPRHSLLLDKADPNRVMATDIKSFCDIFNLKKINKLNISMIEERARPNAWSSVGFIGKDDSLLDVLQKDWKIVDALGTTHVELADHLESIYDIALREETKGSISYDFNALNGNTINNNSSIKQFDVKIQLTQGWQNDIFDSCITSLENFSKCYGDLGSTRTPIFWGIDLFLTNKKNKEYVHVTSGIINYIKKYGFYESGKENYYRIDPIRLASVFTGHSYCSIAKEINQPCNSRAPNDPYYRLN